MRSIKISVIFAMIITIAIASFYNPDMQVFAAENEESGLISGIVKDNNPSLGYITLYFQDGSGYNPDSLNKLLSVRNYTYGYEIPVARDGITVTAEDIKPGDKVFIKLDMDGYIEKLSVKSYYKPVYGTVHIKNSKSIVVKKENGTYVSYPIISGVPVYKNGSLCSVADILPGDKLRLLVQTNGENLNILCIDLEKLTKPVTGIYRGKVEFFDRIGDYLSVSGLQEFVNGKWENSPVIGVGRFAFASDYKARPSKKVSGMVYFVTQKDNKGLNKIINAAFRAKPQYEMAVKDSIINIVGGDKLDLLNTSDIIGLDKSTIVVKDGRLVDVSSLNALDPIKLSMEKSSISSRYTANVLVSDTKIQSGAVVYRGRIKSVSPSKSITVESFAQLNGITWSFTNTPKSFDIDLSVSRLFEDGGIGNMRDVGNGYVGQSIYIVADGSRILIMSTAPYADAPVSGRVTDLTGATFDESGNLVKEPTEIVIAQAMAYDSQTHQWSPSANLNVSVPANAIVIKNGQAGTTALIKPGDELKIMRHSQSKNGIIVICD